MLQSALQIGTPIPHLVNITYALLSFSPITLFSPGWLADRHYSSHLIVATGTETGIETETEPNDRVANARDLLIAPPGPGARTITTAGRGKVTESATARAETVTPPAETEILIGSGDAVVMAAAVATGAGRGLLGRRLEELEVARTSFLLLRESALRLHR